MTGDSPSVPGVMGTSLDPRLQEAMLSAPAGAEFPWPYPDLSLGRELALRIGRGDLRIVPDPNKPQSVKP